MQSHSTFTGLPSDARAVLSTGICQLPMFAAAGGAGCAWLGALQLQHPLPHSSVVHPVCSGEGFLLQAQCSARFSECWGACGCSVVGHTEGPGVGTFPLAHLEVWARRIPEGRRSFHLVAANLVCAVCLLKLFAALRMDFLLPATSTGLNLPWLFGGRKKGA